jgi:hypothetical protein
MVQEVVQMVAERTTVNPYPRGKKLANQIALKLNLPMSFRTVSTIRKVLHFRVQKGRSQPFFKAAQVTKRLQSCTTQLSGDIDWSGGVVMSGEPWFSLCDDLRRMWVHRSVSKEKTFEARKSFPNPSCVGEPVAKVPRVP